MSLPTVFSRTTDNANNLSVCYDIHSDFLAVRKIPLKRRPYLMNNGTEPGSGEVRQTSSEESINTSSKPIDPAVKKIVTLIRAKVLSDRAIHDQVRSSCVVVAMLGSYLDGRFC